MCTAMLVSALLLAVPDSQNSDPSKDLDFWIGDWTLDAYTPTEDGGLSEKDPDHATNTIKRAFKDNIIHESFESPVFKGESWSRFHQPSGKWHQTWVDDQGSYLVLEGGKVGDEFILNMTHPSTVMRMRFTNIKKNSFTWIWEREVEGGYQLAWRLDYRRKGS